MILKAQDPAPLFSLQSDENSVVSLADLSGKKVILYFYPKDNTPGCTREACDFRDIYTEILATGAIILGISKDSPKSHQKFKEKYDLPFPLLSDENGKVCESYNIINKKSMFGKTFLGIQRSTFLIDEEGIIQNVWRKVKVSGHAEQILSKLNTIK